MQFMQNDRLLEALKIMPNPHAKSDVLIMDNLNNIQHFSLCTMKNSLCKYISENIALVSEFSNFRRIHFILFFKSRNFKSNSNNIIFLTYIFNWENLYGRKINNSKPKKNIHTYFAWHLNFGTEEMGNKQSTI